jgi:hypothetical protein
MPTDMEIAGVAVDRLAVIELADRLLHAGHMDTAALLLAYACDDERVALNIEDREAVIDVLADTPDTLAELFEVLVLEHMYRALESVAYPRGPIEGDPTTSEADSLPVSVSSRAAAFLKRETPPAP